MCWIVWHNVPSQQHLYEQFLQVQQVGFVTLGPLRGCLELYYYNMAEWFWWDSSLISTTNRFIRTRNDLQYNVFSGTLSNQWVNPPLNYTSCRALVNKNDVGHFVSIAAVSRYLRVSRYQKLSSPQRYWLIHLIHHIPHMCLTHVYKSV